MLSLLHSFATHTWNAQKHANKIHKRVALTLPPAVRRCREVSEGVKRRDRGGVLWRELFVQHTTKKLEEKEQKKRKTDVAVISAGPGGGCQWWR